MCSSSGALELCGVRVVWCVVGCVSMVDVFVDGVCVSEVSVMSCLASAVLSPKLIVVLGRGRLAPLVA